MSSLRLRPRFRQVVDSSPEEVEERIRSLLSEDKSPCIGQIIKGHINLMLPVKEQHYWSPQLNLSLEKTESGQTLVRGFYGPKPNVWSLFTLGYAALGILSTFVLVYGTSQWMLKKDPVSLWLLVVFGAAAIALYLTAQFGQKIGAQQMFTLHHFYEEAVGSQIRLE